MAHLCTRSLAGALALVGCGCFMFHSPEGEDTPGASAPARPDARVSGDAGVTPWPDAGSVESPSCDPMDAQRAACGVACDAAGPFAFDGHGCVDLMCDCTGTECDRTYGSFEECEAAHAGCDAILCRTTGGDWLRELRYCGHHGCGHPSELDCETPTPACNCGVGRSFEPGLGCVEDPSCTPEDHCLATGGRVERCPAEDGCTPELICDCGPGHDFDPTRGCVFGRPAPDPRGLCEWSGGAWGPVCCHSECGRPCSEPCRDYACTCGPEEIFDSIRGCVRSDTCRARLASERCGNDQGFGHCAGGLVCCERVGREGDSDHVCVAPCCGDASCDPVTGCHI